MSLVQWPSNTVRETLSICIYIWLIYFFLADLHPLSLEDVLNTRSHKRSKVDYYPKHLFLRVLCHSLATEDEVFAPSAGFTLTDLPRSSSPAPFSEKDRNAAAHPEKEEEDSSFDTGASPRFFNKKMGGIIKRRPFFRADVERGIPSPPKHRLTQLANIGDAVSPVVSDQSNG
jgi:hypothetical protein